MKLSAYHKARGDVVEWWKPAGWYDLVYKSRVFTDTYSRDTIIVSNASQVIQGGTGYGPAPISRTWWSILSRTTTSIHSSRIPPMAFSVEVVPVVVNSASFQTKRDGAVSKWLISLNFGTVRKKSD